MQEIKRLAYYLGPVLAFYVFASIVFHAPSYFNKFNANQESVED